MTLEIRKLLVLSTAHVTASTAAMLNSKPVENWPVVGGPYSDYGWVIYAHEEDLDGDIPSDLYAVLAFALSHGCDNVLFDCDAGVIADLPEYDHSAPLGMGDVPVNRSEEAA